MVDADAVEGLDAEERAVLAVDLRPEGRVTAGMVGSALLHAVLLGASAYFVAPLGPGAEEDVEATAEARIAAYLSAAAERERDSADGVVERLQVPGGIGAEGMRARGEEGAQGAMVAKRAAQKRAIGGSEPFVAAMPSRAAALQEASRFGMIGLLHVGDGGDPQAMRAPWGDLDASGRDALSAIGNAWGTSLGDAVGHGALGLSGIGEGGGGEGQGVGLEGGLTFGQGFGCTCGNGYGRLSGSHSTDNGTKMARMRAGSVTVGGRLPADVVSRVVRQAHGRFRRCWQNAAQGQDVSARADLRFVVDATGAVVQASATGALPAHVSACLSRALHGLSFPAPDGGVATITYALLIGS